MLFRSEQSHGPSSHGSGNVKEDAKHTTFVDNNFFEDYKGWGIDLDDGSSNYVVKNNLCIGVGVKLREGALILTVFMINISHQSGSQQGQLLFWFSD